MSSLAYPYELPAAPSDARRGISLTLMTLIVFVLVLILRPADFITALAPLRLALVTFVAALAAWLISGVRIHLFAHATNKFAYALLLLCVISVPASYWPNMSIDTALTYLKQMTLFVLLCNAIRNVASQAMLLGAMSLALSFHAVMAVRDYLLGNLHLGRVFGSAGGAFADPNDLALGFVVMLAPTVWLIQRNTHLLKRALFAGVLLALLAGIVATQSRGGMLGALVVGVLVLKDSRHKVSAGMAAVALASLLLVAAPSGAFDRFQSIVEYHEDESAVSRLHIWIKGVQMIHDHPLTGVGAGAFGIAYGEDYLDSNAPQQAWLTAHNSLIQVAAEVGLAGLLVWCGMVSAGFAALRSARRNLLPLVDCDADAAELCGLCQVLRTSLIGFCVCAMFLSRAYDWLLMMMLGLSVASYLLAERRCAAWDEIALWYQQSPDAATENTSEEISQTANQHAVS